MDTIGRVGQSISLAVERFVTVGEMIADDNSEIKHDMYDACKEARAAGISLEHLCDIAAAGPDPMGSTLSDGTICDRLTMIRTGRALFKSVTRVLLLVDIVVVKQLLLAKDRHSACRTGGRLVSVNNFTEFVRAFTIFGGEMVEFVHATANRQSDRKDERRRAQIAAGRKVLERSTMMLLTSSKSCLRHPECVHSRENRDTVFCQMRRAMDLIHFVVKDGIFEASSSGGAGGDIDDFTVKRVNERDLCNHSDRIAPMSTGDWESEQRNTVYTCLANFSRLVEFARPLTKIDNSAFMNGSGSGSGDSGVETSNGILAGDGQSKELIRSNSERNRHVDLIESDSVHRDQRHHRDQLHHRDQFHRRDHQQHHNHHNHHNNNEQVLHTRNGHYKQHHGGYHAHRHHQHHQHSSHRSTDTELITPSVYMPEFREKLLIAVDKVVEKTQDFTDSAYTSHEHRENILLLCDRTKLELNQLLRIAVNFEQFASSSNFDLNGAVDSVLTAIHDLTRLLAVTAAEQVAESRETMKSTVDLVHQLRNYALNQNHDRLQDCADHLNDNIDHVLEVCKIIRHIALTETLQVQAKFIEINLRIYGPQVITAAQAVATHPSSSVANENLEVFVNMWQWLATDVTSVAKEIVELAQLQTIQRAESQGYLSLPRPGKHGTTSKPLKPSRLDQDEQEKIAKAGLEMKELTTEMDAETEKWNGESDENNDIVKRAKNMSTMAYSMYQFTRGEGTLRTTQDLFTQAEYFAEEANGLYKVVRQFSYQVPAGQNKKELLDQLENVPTYVQTLQFTVKDPTVGKAATFVKVDRVIRETKNLMNVINKVVTTCFECANKYKLDFSGLAGRAATSSRDDEGGSGAAGDSKGATTNPEASM